MRVPGAGARTAALVRRDPLPMPLRPLLLATCLAAALGGPARGEDVLKGPLEAEVERVVDGDTLAVRVRIWLSQELRVHVRLAGVDTPESLQPSCAREEALGDSAALFMTARTEGRRVILTDIRPDKWGGRVVARVTTPEGEDLAEALLARGLARPMAGEARAPWCTTG